MGATGKEAGWGLPRVARSSRGGWHSPDPALKEVALSPPETGVPVAYDTHTTATTHPGSAPTRSTGKAPTQRHATPRHAPSLPKQLLGSVTWTRR